MPISHFDLVSYKILTYYLNRKATAQLKGTNQDPSDQGVWIIIETIPRMFAE